MKLAPRKTHQDVKKSCLWVSGTWMIFSLPPIFLCPLKGILLQNNSNKKTLTFQKKLTSVVPCIAFFAPFLMIYSYNFIY